MTRRSNNLRPYHVLIFLISFYRQCSRFLYLWQYPVDSAREGIIERLVCAKFEANRRSFAQHAINELDNFLESCSENIKLDKDKTEELKAAM